MAFPDLNNVPAFYHNYIRQVADDDVREALRGHLDCIALLVKPLSEEEWNTAYAPGKWTIKELVQHIIDAERIFSARALCMSRGETQSLPGFDENAYATASYANDRTASSLLHELMVVEGATSCLFDSFSEAQLEAIGIANNAPISVHAIGYIIAGHALHHSKVLQERYLSAIVSAA